MVVTFIRDNFRRHVLRSAAKRAHWSTSSSPLSHGCCCCCSLNLWLSHVNSCPLSLQLSSAAVVVDDSYELVFEFSSSSSDCFDLQQGILSVVVDRNSFCFDLALSALLPLDCPRQSDRLDCGDTELQMPAVIVNTNKTEDNT